VFESYKGEIAGWGKLHSDKHSALCSSANKIMEVEIGRACGTNAGGDICKQNLVGKPEGKRPFGILA